MTSQQKPSSNQTSLFQVYLRLRPPIAQQDAASTQQAERCLNVEPPESSDGTQDSPAGPTYITLHPPSDVRKRAIEKFAFTKVFEEDATQLDVFQNIEMPSLIQAVLNEGRDALVATLGVTGSGKSYTILGSKKQRGITQMSLDVLFQSLGDTVRSADDPDDPTLLPSLAAADPSDAQLFSAGSYLESIYYDNGRSSRAQTPMKASSRAQTPMQDGPFSTSTNKRHLPRVTALPQLPDVGQLKVPLKDQSERVVIVSMYEVYNDRIFDLLSPSGITQGSTMSRQGKERRRPLLFKPTEQSPDRKVVAGLRKVVCASYEEAMMVLETGLTERRIAGTGSNSVSSRSHGFFCLEVKRKVRGRKHGETSWVGHSLTVVDLAGSERARTAKTAGATLAEAGKINESLMYLGQCLQMQNDSQEGNKTVVPYRQCKLTELLFSNSFPSNQQASHHRQPQKAIMIVTADPFGDFNATSQILRYSALAREVAVPRVPSVASTILSTRSRSRSQGTNGRTSPHAACNEDLEEAAREIVRITDDYEALIVKLAEEEIARQEAELKLKAAEERCLLIEQEVREECWAEMEERIEEERKRWQQAWEQQVSHAEQHLDKKLEIVSKGFGIYEDPAPTVDERIEELERDNAYLRARIAALERELNSRSPTRKQKQILADSNNTQNAAACRSSLDKGARDTDSEIEKALQRVRNLNLSSDGPSASHVGTKPSKQQGRKVRKLTSRKRDLGPEEDL
ncbi:hypothetical protein VTN49DRAFT_5908 [Thermomyces lanuginosus]|uniref:uncharacterized protein n=1 Tax=Thermomyces lanuginosus TaxID=5541 RepID=UPI00374245D6